ncbi:hypothetical protein Y032_0017g3231 [Ancylostoma ceylanicum]|uniref:Uncharacterized protein n=1 Tax=Ancylostoma ceylanicum TaxID=53326 RepID=A0A016V3I4_9BILA|nr:hypothetical protein Y032_0017g3231 [Ancylostoma ceylanicum]
MKPAFTVDEKWCLYVNIMPSPPWVDKDEQHEPQPKAVLHPLKVMINAWCDFKGVMHALYRPGVVPRDYQLLLTLSNALQEKACDDEDDLDCWLSNFFEPMPVQFPTMKTLLVLLAFCGLAATAWADCPRKDSITKRDIEDSHFSKVSRITTNMAL